MRKISLTIIGRKYFLNYQENDLRKEIAWLSTSSRRYENFTLYAQRPGFLIEDVENLLRMKRRKWKSVKIWSEKFSDEDQLEKLFEHFADSVEVLDLRNLNFVQSLDQQKSTQTKFKKLKQLSLSNVVKSQWFLERLKYSEKLEAFEIENIEDNNAQALSAFLFDASQIKRLSITQAKWNDTLFSQLCKQKLTQLNEFKLKVNSQCSFYQQGLINFLQVQSDTITKLTIDAPISIDVWLTIFKITKLKILHVLTPIAYQSIELPQSLSINEFRVDFNCKSDLLTSLTKSMPNLKVLKTLSTDKM